MILIALLLAIALAGVLLTSLIGLLSGPVDIVSVVGAVICVVAALVIAVGALWVRDE